MNKSPVLWSLLITLFILLGSINTSSALQCYQCAIARCKAGEKGQLKDCQHNMCSRQEGPKGTVFRFCAQHSDKPQTQCTTALAAGGISECFCNTDGCNGGDGSNGSMKLGRMSLCFFTLPILVSWMGRALFEQMHP